MCNYTSRLRELDGSEVRWDALVHMVPGFRHAAILLALTAMVLRALLPMGWMPNSHGFAQSPLAICMMDMPSGADVSHAMDMSMPVDMHGHSHDQGKQQNNEQCPFAAAPHVAAPLAVVNLIPPSTLARFVAHEAFGNSLTGTDRYQPQSPRAPPSQA